MTAYVILDLWIAGVSILFFGGLKKWNRERLKKLSYLLLTFLPMFVLLVVRFHIGYDYDMYMEGFYRMAIDGFSSLSYLDWEPGFVLFSKIVASFTLNLAVYFGIIGAFCLFSAARFIYSYSSKTWLSVILFVNLYFFYLDMNFLRQAMAISIGLFAWSFLKRRKLLPYIGVVLLAACFHTTALIMLLFYPIVKIKPAIKQVLFYCYALLCFFLISDGLMNLVTHIFHQEYQNSVLLDSMSLIYAIIPVLAVICAMIWREQLLAASKSNQGLIALAFLTAFFTLIMTRSAILERMSNYSLFYLILLIPEMITAIEKFGANHKFNRNHPTTQVSKSRMKEQLSIVPYSWQSKLATAIVLLITYCYNWYGMMVNVHGVFPYQTFL